MKNILILYNEVSGDELISAYSDGNGDSDIIELGSYEISKGCSEYSSVPASPYICPPAHYLL